MCRAGTIFAAAEVAPVAGIVSARGRERRRAGAAALCLPAGSLVAALRRQTVGAGRVDNLRRGGGRPGHWNVRARRRERRRAGASGAVRAGRIGRRRARARRTVGAGRVDNLRRSGGRPGDRNIRARGRRAWARSRPAPLYVPAGSVVGALAPAGLYAPAGSTISAAAEVAPVIRNISARRGERGGARARAAVCAGRVGRWRARARAPTVSAGRVYQVSSGASLIVVAGRSAVRIERHNRPRCLH